MGLAPIILWYTETTFTIAFHCIQVIKPRCYDRKGYVGWLGIKYKWQHEDHKSACDVQPLGEVCGAESVSAHVLTS